MWFKCKAHWCVRKCGKSRKIEWIESDSPAYHDMTSEEKEKGTFTAGAGDSFRPHYGPGVDSDFIRNKYKGYLLRIKAVGA